MRSLVARLERLETHLGSGRCTCRGGTMVRLLYGNRMVEDLKSPEGCAKVRRLLTAWPSCPLHGQVNVRTVNLTGKPEGVWHRRMLQALESAEAGFNA